MGGSAFTDPKNPAASLPTPRMPLHVYLHVRDRALRILRAGFYAQAESPVEAPGKADYGDVDILVASPYDQANVDTVSVATALGAVQFKENIPTTNFALPWPNVEELNNEFLPASTTSSAGEDVKTIKSSELEAVASKSTATIITPNAHYDHTNLDVADSPHYIQLDLHVCSTPENFHWELFHQAHGDLWNIFGGMIRPYGLIVNHIGLYLYLAGVEGISKDQRTLQLTTSPSLVLKFLDLDEDRYWTPFDSLDAMFVYAASCRFYNPKTYRGREDLKSNDRQRMKKRPIFKKWYDVYLQEHKGDTPGRTAGASCEKVAEEATRVFGVQKEYEEKRNKGLREMGIERLWSGIRKDLPVEGLRISVIMRGVKRAVLPKTQLASPDEVSGEKGDMVAHGNSEDPSALQRAYVDGRFDEIAEWAKADWEGIEQRQSAYEREQSTKHLLAKIETERAKKLDMETRELEAGTQATDDSAFETAMRREALGS